MASGSILDRITDDLYVIEWAIKELEYRVDTSYGKELLIRLQTQVRYADEDFRTMSGLGKKDD